MDVIAIPTNRPVIRVDHEDAVYKTMDEKYRAIIHKIQRDTRKRSAGPCRHYGYQNIRNSVRHVKKRGLKHES